MATVVIAVAIAVASAYVSHLLQPVQNVGKLDQAALRTLTGYNVPIVQPYGWCRINGCTMIWATPLSQRITGSGKGFASKERKYTYYMTAAFLIGGEITGLSRVWMNGVQVFDESSRNTPGSFGFNFRQRLLNYLKGTINYNQAYGGNASFLDRKSQAFSDNTERYLGAYNQSISSTIAAIENTTYIPAYRGRSYFVTNAYPLAEFNGTGFPNVDVEVFGKLGPQPNIADIILDIFKSAKFDTTRLDLSEIQPLQLVQGVLHQRSGENFQDYVEEIQRLFFLVAREENNIVKFLNKNRNIINLDIGLTSLGAKVDQIKSEPLFQEKILNTRELPSEIQLTVKNIGDSFNPWTAYSRNPVANHDNPLVIQTRISSDPSEARGMANRLLSEILVQKNLYSGINLLPCWYKQLNLGEVVTLDIGTRVLALQLTKKTLTKDFIVQIEGNEYTDSKYTTPTSFHVFVQYYNSTPYLFPNNTIHVPGPVIYSRTAVPLVGNANNLSLAIAYYNSPTPGPCWGILQNNKTFVPLLGPTFTGTTYGAVPVYDPASFVLYLDLDQIWNLDQVTINSGNASKVFPGSIGTIWPDIPQAMHIVGVTQFVDHYAYSTNYDIYNDSQFFGISQVTHNTQPSIVNNYILPQQPSQGNLYIMDIPLINDGDQDFTLYGAVENVLNFTSGTIYYSTDAGASFNKGTPITNSNTVGKVVGFMPSGNPWIIDAVSKITIDSKTVINSVTTTQFLAGDNLILIGDEIIAFRDVTLLSNNQYEISHLIRGVRGTEWAIGTQGYNETAIVLLNLIKLSNQTFNGTSYTGQSYINQDFLFKLVPWDADETDITTTVPLTYKANSVKPYTISNPTHETTSSNDIVLHWYRRTYKNGNLVDYSDIGYASGENPQYLVTVYDHATGTQILRTEIVTSETYVYTLAKQLADGGLPGFYYFEISQISSYVGHGFINRAQIYR